MIVHLFKCCSLEFSCCIVLYWVKRTETTTFYNNSGLFLPSPSSLGFPSFPNSCRCSSCQNLTTTDQSLADFAFGSGRHYKTEAVAKVALSPLFSFFSPLVLSFCLFSVVLFGSDFLPVTAANKYQYAQAKCSKKMPTYFDQTHLLPAALIFLEHF